MTKYEELSHLGQTHTLAHFESRNECRRLAQILMGKLADYLDCPRENMRHYKLHPDWSFGDSGDLLSNAWPDVTQTDDGYWAIGEEITLKGHGSDYAYLTLYCKFGIKKNGKRFTVRYTKDFDIHESDQTSITEFCDFFYSDVKADLSRPFGEQTKRLGFHGGEAVSG